jgi:hypothetical protein
MASKFKRKRGKTKPHAGGRPRKKFTIAGSRVLKALYYYGPLSKTELKKVLYPNNPTGRGVPGIDAELSWLLMPFPPLTSTERKDFLVGHMELFPALGRENTSMAKSRAEAALEKWEKQRADTHFVRYEKVNRVGIHGVACDDDDESVVDNPSLPRVTYNKGAGWQMRYVPQHDWVREEIGCSDKDARLLHSYLLAYEQYGFGSSDSNMDAILRDLLRNYLALRIEQEAGDRWKGYMCLPPDEELYGLMRDKCIWSFVEDDNIYTHILTTNAMHILYESLNAKAKVKRE